VKEELVDLIAFLTLSLLIFTAVYLLPLLILKLILGR